MYEGFTFDYFMQKMLDNVSNDLDKREGSIIWDALAPAALELETAYIMLDYMYMQAFGDTADRDSLILRAHERGLSPYEATPAIIKAEFTPTTIDLMGMRFTLGEYDYVVTELITPGTYKLTCETPGSGGNQSLGDLIPLDEIDDLETAEATEILIPGEDEEDTEDFRQRYLGDFNPQRFGGNIAQYLDWVNAIEGVGGARVARRVAGERNVIVTIISGTFDKATSTLVAAVQNSLDPDGDGEGTGVAPIGHEVSVVAADNQTINIYYEATFDTGYDYSGVAAAVSAAMEEYMLDLRTNWKNYASGTPTVVRTGQIESKLLAITGVLDVSNIKINSVAANFNVTDNKIPVLGVISHG